MPVITRSQSKLRDNVQQRVEDKCVDDVKSLYFTALIQKLIDDIAKTTGLRNKILITTSIYKMLNRRLPRLIEQNKEKWVDFMITLFNKTHELEHGQYSLVDKEVFSTFTKVLIKSRKILYDHYTKTPQNIV